MLDIDDPESNWILKASNLQDAVLTRSKKMTLVETTKRLELLDEIRILCDDMKTLNNKHFSNSQFIKDAIEELYESCEKIANLKATEDKTKEIGICEVCHNKITNLKQYKDMIYCSKCLEVTSKAREKLDSSKGFGTCWI